LPTTRIPLTALSRFFEPGRFVRGSFSPRESSSDRSIKPAKSCVAGVKATSFFRARCIMSARRVGSRRFGRLAVAVVEFPHTAISRFASQAGRQAGERRSSEKPIPVGAAAMSVAAAVVGQQRAASAGASGPLDLWGLTNAKRISF
jgi:hypothetical protein